MDMYGRGGERKERKGIVVYSTSFIERVEGEGEKDRGKNWGEIFPSKNELAID
jgi:hypothetical protein